MRGSRSKIPSKKSRQAEGFNSGVKGLSGGEIRTLTVVDTDWRERLT
jgi:hypothetical protein